MKAVAYLGLHEGDKFYLVTRSHPKGAKPCFPIFSYGKNCFLGRGMAKSQGFLGMLTPYMQHYTLFRKPYYSTYNYVQHVNTWYHDSVYSR